VVLCYISSSNDVSRPSGNLNGQKILRREVLMPSGSTTIDDRGNLGSLATQVPTESRAEPSAR
jgi:hypothetical protein